MPLDLRIVRTRQHGRAIGAVHHHRHDLTPHFVAADREDEAPAFGDADVTDAQICRKYELQIRGIRLIDKCTQRQDAGAEESGPRVEGHEAYPVSSCRRETVNQIRSQRGSAVYGDRPTDRDNIETSCCGGRNF